MINFAFNRVDYIFTIMIQLDLDTLASFWLYNKDIFTYGSLIVLSLLLLQQRRDNEQPRVQRKTRRNRR